MPDAPEEALWRFIEQVMDDIPVRPPHPKPVLAVNNPEPPLPATASPPPELTLVHDANALASDVEAIGRLAMTRIKETLAKPFDPADPSYVALLKFTASVYGTSMNTILRADENRLAIAPSIGCLSCSSGRQITSRLHYQRTSRIGVKHGRHQEHPCPPRSSGAFVRDAHPRDQS